MAKRETQPKRRGLKPEGNAYIEGAGVVEPQQITQTLETNYMPYAMSVILSRALPEIDGFKPSHRKILYTMYKMGLLNGRLTKSANIVGATMKLNPHGDSAIYETMVRLSRGHEALLHPYIESKGNFGKAYSKNMAYAASRYTEAKLAGICEELFSDIDKDTVDFVPNYDDTTQEPTLLPVSFPAILVNSNVGIAVSMASSICPFNLKEICEAVIGLIKDDNFDITNAVNGPDFPGGGKLIYDEAQLNSIYKTGRGSVKIRSKYVYDKENNCVDITQIPPTTTIEAIMGKIAELIKQNKVREISDLRDETDLNGLKITIDLKRGTDPNKFMRKLFKLTPLEDTYSCNFNLLVDGTPMVLGVYDIIKQWRLFRKNCVKRRCGFNLSKNSQKLHLLKGLSKILLDIDKAIKIIRETKDESEVTANLMIGFGIDTQQAEFVADIKLRHLNKEYILKRTEEIRNLEKSIDELKQLLEDDSKIDDIICKELKGVIEKYKTPRKTMVLYLDEPEDEDCEEVPDYEVNLFVTREGYLKKITQKSLKMNSRQKLKDNDKIIFQAVVSNNCDILFFTDKATVYKTNLSAFSDSKSSLLGDFIPAKLGFSEDEKLIYTIAAGDYSGNILFFYENGKLAKIPLKSYKTKNNRKKLTGAYSTVSNLVSVRFELKSGEYLLCSNGKKGLIVNSAMVNPKETRTSQGNYVMRFNKGDYLSKVVKYEEGMINNKYKYVTKNLPAKGSKINPNDYSSQTKIG